MKFYFMLMVNVILVEVGEVVEVFVIYVVVNCGEMEIFVDFCEFIDVEVECE